jgi:hypothetical protein
LQVGKKSGKKVPEKIKSFVEQPIEIIERAVYKQRLICRAGINQAQNYPRKKANEQRAVQKSV